jgi:hypothetical protein
MTAEGRLKILRETALAAATACPFLNPDKRCAIHTTRPLACRAYGVTRLPSQHNCPAPYGAGENLSHRARYEDITLMMGVNSFLRHLKPEWRASYFLPTGVYRLARSGKFLDMADRIATAKMVAMPQSPAVIWQGQLEREWAGVR